MRELCPPQTDLNSPFKRGEGYWKVPAEVERPGSASPDEFAVPAAPDGGDLFDFVSGGAPPAPPPAPRAAPLLPPPEWERTRPFLSGAFLLQARRPVLQQTPARKGECMNSKAQAVL